MFHAPSGRGAHSTWGFWDGNSTRLWGISRSSTHAKLETRHKRTKIMDTKWGLFTLTWRPAEAWMVDFILGHTARSGRSSTETWDTLSFSLLLFLSCVKKQVPSVVPERPVAFFLKDIGKSLKLLSETFIIYVVILGLWTDVNFHFASPCFRLACGSRACFGGWSFQITMECRELDGP